MVTSLNPSQVRVIDPVLSTVVQGYKNPKVVGFSLFPRVNVQVSGGQIIEFGKEAFVVSNLRRSPGAATKRVNFGYLGKPYSLVQDAIECLVPYEYMRDASIVPGIDLASKALNLGMQKTSLPLEIEQATLACNAANYPAANKITLSGTSKWSDPTCNIGKQIDDGKEAIRAQTGAYPNTIVLSATAFRAAKNNPLVIDRFKYTSKESVTAEMLAGLWELDKVEVGTAISSTDGVTTTDVWGNNAVLAYVPQIPTTMEEPSYGYTYVMEGHPFVRSPYQDENIQSWVYGVNYERQAVLSGIVSGYLFINPN